MERKAIPIGYEDIKEIVDKDLYYVDKSLLIRELLDSGSKVSLLTRPRRFGKTLNLSMLRRFFEDERTQAAEEFISQQLLDTISCFDYAENYYHGFLSGLFAGFEDYGRTVQRSAYSD